jgi:peptide chain release factor 3
MSQPDTLTPVDLDRDTRAREVARRRTFAIISHPDAGKTTLTEKLLLYSGAIELAGAVRGGKARRAATSDWMEMEQQRGISISAAALEFEMDGHRVNLLDTPGHQDFSEDTYRTLLAVDSVVMVLDAAKGIEAQTLKLFHVCRDRRIPVLTFINKLDLPSRDPFELLDEIERVLGISAAPMNWPLGDGQNFRGVYDLQQQALLLYERSGQGRRTEPIAITAPSDPLVETIVGPNRQRELIDALEIIAGAGTTFDEEAYRAERQTPVFFGSALQDFGVEPFLKALLRLAPPPVPRQGDTRVVNPGEANFTGFVFKIQANMNPRHRDRVAFFRITSGKLTKDMAVQHGRTGQTIRLSRVYRFFGRDRETVPEGYAGDVVGLVNPGHLTIGDTLYTGAAVQFPPIPSFPPERFGRLRPTEGRHKKFDQAVRELAEEGLLQTFFPPEGTGNPIIGVVGALQFDVVEARMTAEYGIESKVDVLPYTAARWLVPAGDTKPRLKLPWSGVLQAVDRLGRDVLLFETDFALSYTTEHNQAYQLRESW